MIKALLVPFAVPPCFFRHIKNKAYLFPFAVPPCFFRHIKNMAHLAPFAVPPYFFRHIENIYIGPYFRGKKFLPQYLFCLSACHLCPIHIQKS
jgi:hypothetical protein